MKSRSRLVPAILVIAAVLGIACLAFMFSFIYNTMTQGSTDLYPRWKGAELFWREGVNPYDDRIGLESQEQIYGRPARDGEDRVLYAYPFYFIFYLGPLPLIEYQLAAAIVIELMLLGLLLALALVLHMVKWLPPPGLLALLLLFTIGGYFSVRGLSLAQPALIAYTLHVVTLWAIVRGHDRLAGVALALSTGKPQTGFLIVPLLLLWAWRVRRWGMIGAFGVVFGALMIASFVAEPGWLGDWINQMRAYESYTETVPVTHILAYAIDSLPGAVKAAGYGLLSLILLVPVFVFWRRTITTGDPVDLLWGCCLTLAVSVMISPRTATTFYVELYPVLIITALILARRGQGWIAMVGLLVLLVGYWPLHILTLPPEGPAGHGTESPWVYLVFPPVVLGLLFFYRAEWPRLLRTDDRRLDVVLPAPESVAPGEIAPAR